MAVVNRMGLGMGPIFRCETQMGSSFRDMEKRQLFLRSYQFSRKESASEKIKKSLVRVKQAIWVRKLRKMVWFRLRNGLFYGIRRRRVRFIIFQNPLNKYNTSYTPSTSCFW